MKILDSNLKEVMTIQEKCCGQIQLCTTQPISNEEGE